MSLADLFGKIFAFDREAVKKSEDLAKERNYELWFKLALITGIIWFIYKHSFSSFFLCLILLVYLMYNGNRQM